MKPASATGDDLSAGVICPCCNSRFPKFLPYGHGETPRPNAECPGCGALERHRMTALYLKRRTDLFRDRLSLLDIAPHPSLLRLFSALDNVDYVSADLQSPLAMVKTDICKMPFPSGCFDVVICMHVLEHVPDDRQGMAELFRVMKPGGWAIIQVPIESHRRKPSRIQVSPGRRIGSGYFISTTTCGFMVGITTTGWLPPGLLSILSRMRRN